MIEADGDILDPIVDGQVHYRLQRLQHGPFAGRRSSSMVAFRSVVSVLVSFVDASYFGQVVAAGVGGLVRWW